MPKRDTGITKEDREKFGIDWSKVDERSNARLAALKPTQTTATKSKATRTRGNTKTDSTPGAQPNPATVDIPETPPGG